MKKAIQVMATLVAFLLSGHAFATKVYPTMPLIKDVVGATATIVGDGVKFTGSASLFPSEFLGPPINSALAVVPEATIASSAISGLAKKAVLGGLSLGAGVVAGYAIDELLKGVDFVMANGQVSRPASGDSSPQVFTSGEPFTHFPAPGTYGIYTYSNNVYVIVQASTAPPSNCSYANNYDPYFMMYCDGPYVPPKGALIPVTSGDLDVLDGFVKGKDGTWQRDLATELCGGLESCYQAMSPTSQLGGPSTVTGKPQTITTTSPGGSPSVTVKTPSATITYGPNWYDYNPVTTTTSPDGTTTINDSPTSIPVPPSILPPGNDGLKGINDGIPGTTSTTSPIPYMAWYSFSQNCSEITLIIPVYGGFQTALCPIYARYIWPTLYFFFAVFTWIHCWSIWRNTVLRVRAS